LSSQETTTPDPTTTGVFTSFCTYSVLLQFSVPVLRLAAFQTLAELSGDYFHRLFGGDRTEAAVTPFDGDLGRFGRGEKSGRSDPVDTTSTCPVVPPISRSATLDYTTGRALGRQPASD
jgi:hypothetical protein